MPPNAGSRSATAHGCTWAHSSSARQVTADCPKTDRYKRAVCRLEVDGVDANLAQLEAGMAWHYKAYTREQSPADRWRYAKAEDRAREARQGLWADRAPVAPWDFRKARKTTAR
jgi:endonuclease YncB( thermonuclease family)